MQPYKRYTPEESEIILNVYPLYGTYKTRQFLLLKGYNRSTDSIKSFCTRNGLKTNVSGVFKPGHKPYNKGKKMPPELRRKVSKTWFKKGQTGNTAVKPVSALRKYADGYWYVKIAMPNKWTQWHYLLWTEKNGPVPLNHILRFKDGNRDHVNIENLECITRAELMKRNQDPEKRRESLKATWRKKREARKEKMRRGLSEKYGSLSIALAMGETL